MTIWSIAVSTVVLALSGYLFWSVSRLYSRYREIDSPEFDRARFRRDNQRMIRAVGIWQLALAALVVTLSYQEGDGNWSSGITLFMVGLFMIGLASFWRRFDMP